jgi:nitroreductase
VLRDLVKRNRSCRRFYQNVSIPMDVLEEFIDLARLTASSANRQPLKYILCCDREMNEKIFPNLAWAAYLEDWPGPAEGERPAGYVVVLGDRQITDSFACDQGIAVQTILLAATEKGLGGCIIASIRKEVLRRILEIPDQFEILLIVALGKPKETVVLETARSRDQIKYWRDAQGIHHVPKRPLDEIIIRTYA